MGLTGIAVQLKSFTSGDAFQSQFFVNTGAMVSMAPASELRRIGIEPVGKRIYELATGLSLSMNSGLRRSCS